MDFKNYLNLFNEILSGKISDSPYQEEKYIAYTKLNQARMNRWEKKALLNPILVQKINEINEKQYWIIISEPWCGDAAHSLPFIHKLAELNPKITLEIQLRDTNSEIQSYLTNKTLSIPILIIRNEKREDLLVWGPRPSICQNLFLDLKKSDLSPERQKEILQQWYNQDKGQTLQSDLLEKMNHSWD